MIKSLIRTGILFAAFIILFEKWIGNKRYSATKPTITQTKLAVAENLLDEDGRVTGEGWMIDAPWF